jgi:hypothetical protein
MRRLREEIPLFPLLANAVIDKNIRGSFEKFVDWQQCIVVMQREAVTVIPSFSDGSNVVLA